MALVAVVPGGAWGTALAAVLAHNGHETRIYSRRKDVVESISQRGENPLYLPGIRLPRRLAASEDLKWVVGGADLLVFVPSSEGFRELARSLAPIVSSHVPVVSATKGLEPGTGLRMTEILAQELRTVPQDHLLALSGPNFASEIAERLPASTVIAGGDHRAAAHAQALFGSSRLRVYTNSDLTGVEMAGALKNVLALGTGIVHGAGLGYNAEAALITRGLAEIARLAVTYGSNPSTFAGLAGLGDVVLTCTGTMSRNRRAGILLGQGTLLSDILASMTVEGVRTTVAAHEMALEKGVEMPVTAEIHSIITQGKSPYRAALSLMKRELKAEFHEGAVEQRE